MARNAYFLYFILHREICELVPPLSDIVGEDGDNQYKLLTSCHCDENRKII
jgi:hypothetical protein